MCFILEDDTLKIATKDIECYKVMVSWDNVILQSPCMGYKYCLNEKQPVVKLNIIEEYDSRKTIEAGYHSFKTLEFTKTCFLMYTTKVKCVIPEGTKYYENDREYVSETIVVKEIID